MFKQLQRPYTMKHSHMVSDSKCSLCRQFKPSDDSNYNHFVCLACGQVWKRWVINDLVAWYNDGVLNFETMEKVYHGEEKEL